MNMGLKRGDHVCAMYTTRFELAHIAAEFLEDGLRRGQRCWYVAAGDESELVRIELGKRNVEVASEIRRGALRLVEDANAYTVRGSFRAEHSIQVFNDAIELALREGFSGFRAAADMSWALRLPDGPAQLIEYEALLRTLFASARATGLCLYDRASMPLNVIDGALATHPKVRAIDGYRANTFYDIETVALGPAED